MGNENASGVERLGGLRAWCVWLLSVAFVVYYFSFQTGYAVVNTNVQTDLGLTVSQVGFVAALYTWVFACCQFLSGPLLDRLGAGKVIPPAIALVTVGVFAFANARGYEGLLISQMIIALGACSGFVGAGYVGGRWFGLAKFSLMFGLVQFAASFFAAFNQNLLTLALQYLSWRGLFNYIGIAGIVLFVASSLFLRDPSPPERPRQHFSAFIVSVLEGLLEVAKVPRLWLAAAFGALCFGVMLALGVVWAPKLFIARGFDSATANWCASLLWLGLAAGCLSIPRWSDELGERKRPMILGVAGQTIALGLLLYLPDLNAVAGMGLCFLFGFANASHMLAFSSAGDLVKANQIGTSAAIVNGVMFIAGGILISRPGVRIGAGLESGMASKSIELTQHAALPLVVASVAALLIAFVMRETYPRQTLPRQDASRARLA